MHIHYITEGAGPDLVLLHTLRTQLDMFQKVIPELAREFRVHALDYPGHGRSDTPDASYTAEFLVESVGTFLGERKIQHAILVGESIGGTIALVLAARHDARVRGVVAINPYDYNRGRGLMTSSMLARIVFTMRALPLIGPVVRRVNAYPVVSRIMLGGVYRREAFPPALLREVVNTVHPLAFDRLVDNWPTWEAMRAEYGAIRVPVQLLYGDHDWSRVADRECDAKAIPGARLTIVPQASHFLSLDNPQAVLTAVHDLVRLL